MPPLLLHPGTNAEPPGWGTIDLKGDSTCAFSSPRSASLPTPPWRRLRPNSTLID
jgi:hypothetical protein